MQAAIFSRKAYSIAMNENHKERIRLNRRAAALLVAVIATMLINGCRNASAPHTNLSAAPSATATPTPQSAFERDLQYARSSQEFNKIYVFARKDNGTIDAADADLLKAKAPADPHIWWVLTDEKRRVIMGTYSDFAPEKLNALRQHFLVEDYTNR